MIYYYYIFFFLTSIAHLVIYSFNHHILFHYLCNCYIVHNPFIYLVNILFNNNLLSNIIFIYLIFNHIKVNII